MSKHFMLKKNLSVLCFILIVGTIFFPLISGSLAQRAYPVDEETTLFGNDWWPMFHHDAAHIGFSTASAPLDNDILWSYQTNDLITSSPVVAHGRVYMGSWDYTLYCFDMDTGLLLWNYSTFGIITATPAVVNGKLYIGSQDSKLYCLDAITGDYLWDYDTSSMVESSPTVIDGMVFFGSSDGNLYCIDADDGTLIWSYATNNIIWSSPAVTDTAVYVGVLDGRFLRLNKMTGDLVWSYSTGSGIWSSPAVVNNRVYFGSNDNNVYCLNTIDGSLLWNYSTLGEIHSSPAVTSDNVYIGSSDGRLLCLNANTGVFVWDYAVAGGVWSPPSLAGGNVYFANDPCCGNPSYIFCLNASNGMLIWQYNFNSQIGIKASPALAAGKVFIGTGDGRLVVFGDIEYLADAHGPYYGFVDDAFSFSGSVYGGTPGFSWLWNFGDGSTSTEQNPTHSYGAAGEYFVTLMVTDSLAQVAMDDTVAVIIEPNRPPVVPEIFGPVNGKAGETYTYCIIGVDPDVDDLFVFWEWGDGENTGWLGPYVSGSEICASHTWVTKGAYTVSVMLKDVHGEVVSASLEVSMPHIQFMIHSLVAQFFTWLFSFMSQVWGHLHVQ